MPLCWSSVRSSKLSKDMHVATQNQPPTVMLRPLLRTERAPGGRWKRVRDLEEKAHARMTAWICWAASVPASAFAARCARGFVSPRGERHSPGYSRKSYVYMYAKPHGDCALKLHGEGSDANAATAFSVPDHPRVSLEGFFAHPWHFSISFQLLAVCIVGHGGTSCPLTISIR